MKKKQWKKYARAQEKACDSLYHQNNRLRIHLEDAWTLGSTHQKPSMEQLNEWRATINNKEAETEEHKIKAEDTVS